jgi:hypothetical protein
MTGCSRIPSLSLDLQTLLRCWMLNRIQALTRLRNPTS